MDVFLWLVGLLVSPLLLILSGNFPSIFLGTLPTRQASCSSVGCHSSSWPAPFVTCYGIYRKMCFELSKYIGWSEEVDVRDQRTAAPVSLQKGKEKQKKCSVSLYLIALCGTKSRNSPPFFSLSKLAFWQKRLLFSYSIWRYYHLFPLFSLLFNILLLTYFHQRREGEQTYCMQGMQGWFHQMRNPLLKEPASLCLLMWVYSELWSHSKQSGKFSFLSCLIFALFIINTWWWNWGQIVVPALHCQDSPWRTEDCSVATFLMTITEFWVGFFFQEISQWQAGICKEPKH